ncbi:MAG: gliding motility protein GldN [Paludibacteraceae bacterium]|nr:gliding motility protein GldN [Paludibacteraceae bacterium]MBO5012470.1 gliding motility protein GldN [Paludibacteraceae bacterium]
MKKVCLIIFALVGFATTQAQYQVNSFFDNMGIVRLETQELSETADTLVSKFHRADDIVWSRVVYRIIDMRFKQNYQLYNPVSSEDPQYKSLFLVMLNAIKDGMDVYEKSSEVGDIKPYFNLPPMPREMIPTILNTDRTGELSDGNIATSEYMLLNYDSTTNEMRFNNYTYKGFVRNQLKYVIQEIVFFDKHYSRLYSKILGIAPMHADNTTYYDGQPIMEALYGQILFWVPFDAFRPYMAQQYVMQSDNESKRVTFDDFFLKKLYSSYVVGASNVYDRMIPDYATTPEAIAKEQERIEWELLSAEQDLWEY